MSDDPNKEQKPTVDLSALIDPTTGLIAGKWKTVEEANKGIKEAGNSLAAERKRADDLAQKVSMYEPIVGQLIGGAGTTPGYNGELDPRKELNDMGILSPIERLVSQEVERKVKEQHQNTFGPLLGTAQARDLMAERFPEYLKQESEILGHINKTPELKSNYDRAAKTGDPELMAMALDNGRLRWIEAGGGERKSATETPEAKAAKAAASLPGGGSPGNRNAATDTGDRQKEMDAAREEYRRTKDPGAFMAAFNKNKPVTWNDWLAAQQNQG